MILYCICCEVVIAYIIRIEQGVILNSHSVLIIMQCVLGGRYKKVKTKLPYDCYH